MAFIDDLDVFFRLKSSGGFAESATYTPKGGIAGDAFPLVLDETVLSVDVWTNQSTRGFIRAVVKTSDAEDQNITSKYHANLTNRDYVTVAGIDYGVMDVMPDQNGMTILELERNEQIRQ